MWKIIGAIVLVLLLILAFGCLIGWFVWSVLQIGNEDDILEDNSDPEKDPSHWKNGW